MGRLSEVGTIETLCSAPLTVTKHMMQWLCAARFHWHDGGNYKLKKEVWQRCSGTPRTRVLLRPLTIPRSIEVPADREDCASIREGPKHLGG